MIQRHRKKPSESKGQRAYYCVKMVSKMGPDIDGLAHMVVPRLVLLIIESGHSSQPNALFCFMTNSITLKGILRGRGAIENPKKKFFFMCAPKYILLLSKGRIYG